MKFKNTSAKIIGIEGHSILPDEIYEVDDAVGMSDSVLSLVAFGLMAIVEEPKKAEPVVEKKVEEIVEDRVEELPKTTKKKTTKKTEE